MDKVIYADSCDSGGRVFDSAAVRVRCPLGCSGSPGMGGVSHWPRRQKRLTLEYHLSGLGLPPEAAFTEDGRSGRRALYNADLYSRERSD